MTKRFLLGLTVILAICLRFYLLGSMPPGLNRDEAALGYNAYSIYKTGRDEHGQFLPLNFISFGDYKLPGYIYSLVPVVSLLGLTPFSIRVLSALAGTASVVLSYWLTLELFSHCLSRHKIALLTALLLSFSPWALHFSRVAYEANLASLLFVLGLWLFLKFMARPARSVYLVLSAVTFSSTLYFYHSYHLFLPVFILGLVALYKQTLFDHFRATLLALLLGSCLALPIYCFSFQSGNQTKFLGTSIFTDSAQVYAHTVEPRVAPDATWLTRLTANRPVYFTKVIATNYLAHYLPGFLVIRGGQHPVHNPGRIGNLHPLTYIFCLFGLYYLFHQRQSFIHAKLLLLWVITAPLPAVITRDAPHTVRSLPLFAGLIIVAVVGWVFLLSHFKSRFYYLVSSASLAIITLISLVYFLQFYFFVFPLTRAEYWNPNLSALTQWLNQPEQANRSVYFDHPDYSPYIQLLVYSHYSPSLFSSTAEYYPADKYGFKHVARFGRYHFVNNLNSSIIPAGSIIVRQVGFKSPPPAAAGLTYYLPNGQPDILVDHL